MGLTGESKFSFKAESEHESLKLETTITMKKNKGRRDFISEVVFYKKGKRATNLEELYGKEFENLMKSYKNEIDSQDKNHIDQFFLRPDNKSNKLRFLDRIKNIPLMLDVVTSSLNVIMLDNNKQPMARTTIELDSDIITILRQDLGTKEMEMLQSIQGINVHFVNRVFKEQIFRFVEILYDKIKLSRRIFVIVGIAVSLADLKFLTLSHFEDIQTTYNPGLSEFIALQQILIPVGLFFVGKYWKKLIMYIIRKGLRLLLHLFNK